MPQAKKAAYRDRDLQRAAQGASNERGKMAGAARGSIGVLVALEEQGVAVAGSRQHASKQILYLLIDASRERQALVKNTYTCGFMNHRMFVSIPNFRRVGHPAPVGYSGVWTEHNLSRMLVALSKCGTYCYHQS
jgi:hypothetical protein